MGFVGTEHDSFLHPVSLLEIFGNFLSYLANTIFYNDVVIVIGIVVDAVFYQLTVNVSLTFNWSPAVTNICLYVDNLERSQEAIVNTLFQTICIKRLTEVSDVRLILRFLWCGCHTKLNSSLEIFKYFSPAAIIFCTSSVTLVNNYHIEKLRLKKLFVVLFSVIANKLLIEREIHLMGCRFGTLIFLVVNLMNIIGKRFEVLLY